MKAQESRRRALRSDEVVKLALPLVQISESKYNSSNSSNISDYQEQHDSPKALNAQKALNYITRQLGEINQAYEKYEHQGEGHLASVQRPINWLRDYVTSIRKQSLHVEKRISKLYDEICRLIQFLVDRNEVVNPQKLNFTSRKNSEISNMHSVIEHSLASEYSYDIYLPNAPIESKRQTGMQIPMTITRLPLEKLQSMPSARYRTASPRPNEKLKMHQLYCDLSQKNKMIGDLANKNAEKNLEIDSLRDEIEELKSAYLEQESVAHFHSYSKSSTSKSSSCSKTSTWISCKGLLQISSRSAKEKLIDSLRQELDEVDTQSQEHNQGKFLRMIELAFESIAQDLSMRFMNTSKEIEEDQESSECGSRISRISYGDSLADQGNLQEIKNYFMNYVDQIIGQLPPTMISVSNSKKKPILMVAPQQYLLDLERKKHEKQLEGVIGRRMERVGRFVEREWHVEGKSAWERMEEVFLAEEEVLSQLEKKVESREREMRQLKYKNIQLAKKFY